MRQALSIFALGLATFLARGQATVNFHIQDPFGRSLPLSRVTLTPVPNLYPSTNGLNGQVTGDSLFFRTDTNANYTATNVIAGTYRQATFGPTIITTNYLLIPATTNAINASDYVTLYPTGIGHLLYEEAGVVGGRILAEP